MGRRSGPILGTTKWPQYRLRRLKLPPNLPLQHATFSNEQLDQRFRACRVFIRSTSAVALALAFSLSFSPVSFAHDVINGTASWYGPGFNGGKTANGERYNMYEMTAAHKDTGIRHPGQGYQTRATANRWWFRINDRGPYVRSREIDLSKAAAEKLGMIRSGTAPVTIEIL